MAKGIHLSALAKNICRQLFCNPRVDLICPTTGRILHFIPLSEGHFLKIIDMQAGLNAYTAYNYAYILTVDRNRVNIWNIPEKGEPAFVGYVNYPTERGIVSYVDLPSKLELTVAEEDVNPKHGENREDEVAGEQEGKIICLSQGI